MLTWDILYRSFEENPRDVKTHPITNVLPKWFYAYSENGDICIQNSQVQQPSCSIKGIRKLMRTHFEEIYDVYIRREKGDSVSKEAADITRQSSYWYGVLFAVEHGE